MSWYRIDCRECHRGAGKHYNQTLYIYDEVDIIRVLEKYKINGGVPHSKVPNIQKLSEKKTLVFEDYIERELNLPIHDARRGAIRFRMEEKPPV